MSVQGENLYRIAGYEEEKKRPKRTPNGKPVKT
jgi:hypothetical protein